MCLICSKLHTAGPWKPKSYKPRSWWVVILSKTFSFFQSFSFKIGTLACRNPQVSACPGRRENQWVTVVISACKHGNVGSAKLSTPLHTCTPLSGFPALMTTCMVSVREGALCDQLGGGGELNISCLSTQPPTMRHRVLLECCTIVWWLAVFLRCQFESINSWHFYIAWNLFAVVHFTTEIL